jgi:hypothetical protein
MSTNTLRRTRGALLMAALIGALSHLTFAQSVAPTTMPHEHSEDSEEPKAGHLVNELFVGEKIYIQDKGEWNLVITPSFTQANDAKETELSAELKYGLTDQISLSLEVPAVVVNPDEGSQHVGLGDISVGISYDFIQSDNFSLGFSSDFSLPTGDEDRDLGGGEFVWEPSIVSAFKVGQGEIYASVGGEIGDNHHDEVTYSLAGAYPIDKFVGLLELSGASTNDDTELYLVPGLFWHPNEKMEFGFGVPIGLTDESDDYRLVAKLVFEF